MNHRTIAVSHYLPTKYWETGSPDIWLHSHKVWSWKTEMVKDIPSPLCSRKEFNHHLSPHDLYKTWDAPLFIYDKARQRFSKFHSLLYKRFAELLSPLIHLNKMVVNLTKHQWSFSPAHRTLNLELHSALGIWITDASPKSLTTKKDISWSTAWNLFFLVLFTPSDRRKTLSYQIFQMLVVPTATALFIWQWSQRHHCRNLSEWSSPLKSGFVFHLTFFMS